MCFTKTDLMQIRRRHSCIRPMNSMPRVFHMSTQRLDDSSSGRCKTCFDTAPEDELHPNFWSKVSPFGSQGAAWWLWKEIPRTLLPFHGSRRHLLLVSVPNSIR